ncbi:MFS transporter, DHA1 family, tetracycline resistance protein [Sulfitobacter marinus]|uniref:MFS transporter, DHA1 family, tetracycline resistance protein n=1 Tax=Sulfitobacter marinus TaxID=394264 RepID=A0A1I6RPD7_9RHOB|nr:MFS transporter, DHA1 family, tetracycline resistance protein [Sulfitobacter marinus]
MRPAALFILATVMIDSMGIGLIIPVMPDLIEEVRGANLSQAALWGGVLATTFAVMQFLFSPLVGSLSDRFGRRPILLTSLTVMALDYVLMALAGSIWLLLLGRVIGGISAATAATASTYMADISAPKDRAANFGLVSAGFGMGFVLGPVAGGFLAELGTRAPFWAAAALAASNVAFGWVVLKETVAPENARPLSLRRANPLGAVRHLGALPGIKRLLLVYFLYHLAFAVYPSVWSYFGKAQFDWSPALIGASLALFGLSMAIVQAGVIRPVLKNLGERGTVLFGYVFSAVTFFLIATVTSGTTVLLLTPLAALAGVIPVALQGIMSQAVAQNAQGELQGVLTSASALAMVVAPLAMTSTFAAFTAPGAAPYFPGAPFLLSLLLTVIAVSIFIRWQPPRVTS